MVISTTLTPPSARARATSTSWLLSGERTMATMPPASTWRSWSSLLMASVIARWRANGERCLGRRKRQGPPDHDGRRPFACCRRIMLLVLDLLDPLDVLFDLLPVVGRQAADHVGLGRGPVLGR